MNTPAQRNSMPQGISARQHRSLPVRVMCFLTLATLVPPARIQAAPEKPPELTPPRQILLDVHVVTMKRRDLPKLGAWHKVTLHFDESSASPSSDRGEAKDYNAVSAQMLRAVDQAATDSLWRMLKDLEKEKRLRFVAQVQLVRRNGHEALLRAIQGEWFLMSGPNESCTSVFRTCRSKIPSTRGMSITPHVGDDNGIVLASTFDIFAGYEEKETARRNSLQQTEVYSVTIQNGGTVAWAGLMQAGQQDQKKPSGLAALPLIGGLFRSNKPRNLVEETVILITPSLIPEPPRRP